MKLSNLPGIGGGLAVLVGAVVIVSSLADSSDRGTVFAEAGQGPGPYLERPGPEHERCVRDTAYMRYHHWELLRELREQAVRDGVRGEITLARCRDCHLSRDKFCNRCHNAVNLSPDCFGCHYYPATPEAAAAGERTDDAPPAQDPAGEKAGDRPGGND